MNERKLLGYDEQLLKVENGYDFGARSYKFSPIYESLRGSIVTQAIRMCRECGSIISATGGPGYRSVCLKCYPVLKLTDFNQGHNHEIKDR